MADDNDPVDTSGLTDADWAAINKLKRAHETGGNKALRAAFKELMKDPMRAYKVIGAYRPVETREATRDAMAEIGMTEEDLREMIQKLDPPPTKQ